MNVSPKTVQWIHNFLRTRLQWVKIGNVISDVRIINTGAPQGCVISPVLFSFYASDCLCSRPDCTIYINKRTNVNLVRECSQRWLDFQLWFLRTLIEYILPLNHWTLFFAKLFNYYGNNQKTGRLLPGVAMFHVFYSYLMKRMRTDSQFVHGV